MEIKNLKAKALALLKNGASGKEISEELNLPLSLVAEWQNQLSLADKTAIEVNSIALQKASLLVKDNKPKNSEDLKIALLSLALSLTDELKYGVKDLEIAKSLALTANTIATLQKAFFSDNNNQIAIINNSSKEELSTFRGLLRE